MSSSFRFTLLVPIIINSYHPVYDRLAGLVYLVYFVFIFFPTFFFCFWTQICESPLVTRYMMKTRRFKNFNNRNGPFSDTGYISTIDIISAIQYKISTRRMEMPASAKHVSFRIFNFLNVKCRGYTFVASYVHNVIMSRINFCSSPNQIVWINSIRLLFGLG